MISLFFAPTYKQFVEEKKASFSRDDGLPQFSLIIKTASAERVYSLDYPCREEGNVTLYFPLIPEMSKYSKRDVRPNSLVARKLHFKYLERLAPSKLVKTEILIVNEEQGVLNFRRLPVPTKRQGLALQKPMPHKRIAYSAKSCEDNETKIFVSRVD